MVVYMDNGLKMEKFKVWYKSVHATMDVCESIAVVDHIIVFGCSINDCL